MVALVPPQRVNLPLASTAGITAGAVIALGFFVLPAGLLDSLVDATHIASVLPAAEPPLGFTARSVLALGFGTLAGGAVWLALGMAKAGTMLTFGKAKPEEPLMSDRATLVLRRADAHPDAPPRAPLVASRDLGTPFLEVQAPTPAPKKPVVEIVAQLEAPATVERVVAPSLPAAIPADLDTPLAAYAPSDWCPAPAPEAKPAPVSRVPALAEGERIEAFELTPVAGPAQRPGEHPASIQTLLDRLENGITQRPPVAPRRSTGSLQDTIAELRRVAAAHR
jgi:hypothetical protein